MNHGQMQSCYLAGPMRGYPEYNFPAFFVAAASLRARGYKVWSPAENDVSLDGFVPSKDAAQPMRHYMKRDLPAVLDADFVAVLPGWEQSQGAKCEVYVARACGIPVLNAGDLSVVTWEPDPKAKDGLMTIRSEGAVIVKADEVDITGFVFEDVDLPTGRREAIAWAIERLETAMEKEMIIAIGVDLG